MAEASAKQGGGLAKIVFFAVLAVVLISGLIFKPEHAGLAIHPPMDQFIVTPPLFGGDLGAFTITNQTLWLALTVIAIILLLVVGSRGRAIIPRAASRSPNWPMVSSTRWSRTWLARMP